MATKSAQEPGASTDSVEELLDTVDVTMERLKTLYEQYFLGIQKQAPAFIHSDIERKLRELTQINIRNTGLRYRLATLQQKFGSYNSYWRRTLRQIESGTYARNLSKIGRAAAKSGAEIPEEILAAMPKRMREQVLRDREQAIAIAKRRNLDAGGEEFGTTEEATNEDALAAVVSEPTALRRDLKAQGGAHLLGEDDGELDIEAFFAEVEAETPRPVAASQPAAPSQPAPLRAASLGAPRQTGTMPVVTAMPRHPTGSMPAVVPPMPRQPTGPAQAVHPNTARQPRADTDTEAAPMHLPPEETARPIRAQTQPGVQPARPSAPTMPTGRHTGLIPTMPVAGRPPGTRPQTGPVPTTPGSTGPVPTYPQNTTAARQTGPIPALPARTPTSAMPMLTDPGATGQRPMPSPANTQAIPRPIIPSPSSGGAKAPSQSSRPNPVAPGSAAAKGPVEVESMSGPFPRTQPIPRPQASQPMPKTPPVAAPQQPRPQPQPGALRPPPGMTDADVNALYAKYVKAKEMVGEKVEPGGQSKLLKTINAQAPKIMEQYKAKGVEFSVVVKDNQVVIRAKPKT